MKPLAYYNNYSIWNGHIAYYGRMPGLVNKAELKNMDFNDDLSKTIVIPMDIMHLHV